MSFFNTLTPRNQQNYELEADCNLDTSKGYFIFGAQGIGKTVLALQFCKKWLEANTYVKNDYETNFIEFINFLDLIKIARTSNAIGDEGWQARQKLKSLKEVDLLVIDDIGTEKQTDFVQETVYDIINYRYEYLKQTVITSNFDLPEISDKYHPRIASRIGGMCEAVTPKNKVDLRVV